MKIAIGIVFIGINVSAINTSFVINNINQSSYFEFVCHGSVSDKEKENFSKAISKYKILLRQPTSTVDGVHSDLILTIHRLNPFRKYDKVIVLTQKGLPANYFSITDCTKFSIISTNNIRNILHNIPIELFITKEIISVSLLFLRKIHVEHPYHNKTKGCFYDQCKHIADVRSSLWGDICDVCASRLQTAGVKRKSQREAIGMLQNCFSFNFNFKDIGMRIRPNPFLLDEKRYQVKKNQIFVAIAWELIDSVYTDLKETLEKHKYHVVNAEDHTGQIVFKDIWRLMNESELILIDFSKRRPNVYLEFGMAIVLGKPIVAITQDKADLPSDTPHIRWHLYKNEKGDMTFSKLPKAIVDTITDYEEL